MLWILGKEPYDTKNIFSEDEIKSIMNVIKYVNDEECDESSIDADIYNTWRCTFFNPGNELIIEFYMSLIDYLNRTNYLDDKLNLIFQNKEKNYYQEVLLNKFFMEKEKNDEIKIIKLYDFLRKLSVINGEDQLSLDMETHIGNVKPFPDNDLNIYSNFLNIPKEYKASIFNSNDTYNLFIGQCAELIAYKKLKEKIKNKTHLELIWVSREIGDGFGYDMMIIDHKRNITHLIEIKGTNNAKNFRSIYLTDNELRVCKEASELENVDYRVRKLLLFNQENHIYYMTKDYMYDELMIDEDKKREKTITRSKH